MHLIFVDGDDDDNDEDDGPYHGNDQVDCGAVDGMRSSRCRSDYFRRLWVEKRKPVHVDRIIL